MNIGSRIVVLTIAATVATPCVAAGDFPLASCKSWNGTIVERSGIDTPRAQMKGVITKADIQEYCERDPGGETIEYGGKLTTGECVDLHFREVRAIKLAARANCEQALLDFDYGSETKRVRFPVEDTSCASGSPPLIAQFKILCPNQAKRLKLN